MSPPLGQTLVQYPSGCEIVFTRVVAAPREFVWEVWTTPRHVVRWWGPQGFTHTIHEMDMRPGGLWRLTMHGPDGVDYPNRMEFLEIVKPDRLVYHHGDDANPQQFHVTTTFSAEGSRTKIVTHLRFKTPEACAAVKAFASEGHQSTMARLEALLAELEPAAREIVNTRVFNVSREILFRTFSDPRHLARWWGPHGFTNTIHEFDLKPGGRWRLTLRGPDGTDYTNEKHFLEVVPPERVVLQHVQPMHTFQMTMTFSSEAAGTRLTWRMLFDSAEEADRLRDLISTANEENFDRLEAYLPKLV